MYLLTRFGSALSISASFSSAMIRFISAGFLAELRAELVVLP
jgi:hypothetical protein